MSLSDSLIIGKCKRWTSANSDTATTGFDWVDHQLITPQRSRSLHSFLTYRKRGLAWGRDRPKDIIISVSKRGTKRCTVSCDTILLV